MTKPFVLHGTWLVLAAAAFAAGRWSARRPPHNPPTTGVALTRPAIDPIPSPPTIDGQTGKSMLPPEDAASWVQRFRGSDGTISAVQMSAAIQDALRESDPVKSMMNFSQLIKELTPENAPAAFKAMRETVTGMEAMRYMPMLSYAWGMIDGENALAAMKDMGGREAMFGSAATLAGWASKDPLAAKKWAEENGTEDTRWLLNRALITGIARNDIDGATQFVLGLAEADRGNLVEVLVEQKMKSGLDEATRWALGLQDPGMKGSALDRVAQQYTRQDPAKAAEWVKQYVGESFAKSAVGTVAREYAQKDPKAALGWAGDLPPGDSQSEAHSRVFREWGRTDPTAASESLNTMPAGASKDQAINSFARSIARENPEDALTWSASIQDPKTREEAQIEVVQRWRTNNADAATQWAASHLSPEAQAKAAQAPLLDYRRAGPFAGGFPPADAVRRFIGIGN
ncbi:MAG: hypothetical protein ACR2OZ_18660 [Verrucomicrobiales bacterium]